MRRNKYLLSLVILPIFLLSLATTNVPAQEPYVKVYVLEGPDGYIPGVDPTAPWPGNAVMIPVIIEVTGITDGSTAGILQWGMDVAVDPAVLEFFIAAGAMDTYYLYDWCKANYYDPIFNVWYYGPPALYQGTMDAEAGYWDELSEVIMPVPPGGAGSGYSGRKLVMIVCKSLSLTAYSKIDLIDVEYMDATGNWHAVDEVVDGDYNAPPVPEFPLGSVAPIALIAAIAYIWWVTRRKRQEAV